MRWMNGEVIAREMLKGLRRSTRKSWDGTLSGIGNQKRSESAFVGLRDEDEECCAGWNRSISAGGCIMSMSYH